MKTINRKLVAAAIFATTASMAHAEFITPPPMVGTDVGCIEKLCFWQINPYVTGNYGSLKCNDTSKILTYVAGELVCKPG